jgi:hypothetical protein
MDHPQKNEIAPEVVGPKGAMRMGGWGRTRLYQLIADGELESYLDGRVRRITVRSIRSRIERKLQEAKAKAA